MKTPTIYSGSYGYEDADPIGTIIVTSAEAFEAAMTEALRDEEIRSFDSCDGEHDYDVEGDCPFCNPSLWYVGPFQESLLETVRAARIVSGIHPTQILADLRADGRSSF